MRRTMLYGVAFQVLAGCATLNAADKKEDAGELPKPPEGNLKYSITVSSFENKAGWRGKWEIGDAFTEMMTDALVGSGWFIVLGDKEMRGEALAEQDFAASGRAAGGNKAPQTGQMTPAQLLVKGAVTHVQESTGGGSGGLGYKGIRAGGSKDSAEVNITVYLVDSQTGQVLASTKVVGKSGKKAIALGYHGSKLGGLTGDMAAFKADNVGKACEDALGQSVVFLVKQLDEVKWTGSIVSVNGEKIIINRGEREGVAVDATFSVGKVEKIIDPDTGEVLDEEMTEAGTIKVTQVKEKISYCSPVTGGDKIAKGMTIVPGKAEAAAE